MRFHARWQPQTARQFLGNDLLRVVAEHDVNFVRGGIEIVEQALRVKRAASTGDGDEDFQLFSPFPRSMSEDSPANKIALAGKTTVPGSVGAQASNQS